jgi:hypothetical protein
MRGAGEIAQDAAEDFGMQRFHAAFEKRRKAREVADIESCDAVLLEVSARTGSGINRHSGGREIAGQVDHSGAIVCGKEGSAF